MGVFYHRYFHRIGFGAEADRIRHAYQARERDQAAQCVTDEMVDAVTILGNPQQCRDQIQTFFDAGVQEIRLVFNELNKETYLQTLKALAPRG
jgi:alkanesulfonate monooxygenase SsuD/methylene tetrahydromethanopterin reductase-like flavin-dependent oxidoreductase (luciferase family)